MSEDRQISGLVIGTLVIGLVALLLVTVVPPLFQGNLVVDSYEATFSTDGTLHEEYIYNVHTSGEDPYAVPFMGVTAYL